MIKTSPTIAAFTIEDAAAYISVSKSTMRRLVKEAIIPHIRVGYKLIRINRKDLDNYLNNAVYGLNGKKN